MNEKNRLKILVGVLCVVLVLLTSVVALILDSQSPNPVFGIFQTEPIASTEEPQNSTETTEGSSQETEIPVSTEEPQSTTETTEGSSQEPEIPVSTEEPQSTTETTEGSSQEPEIPVSTEEPQSTTETTEGSSQETENPDPTEEQPTPPEEQLPSVVIPPDKDPETGEEIGISFPCQIPGYDMTIEKIAPYNGMFVEDGSNANAQNVAMLLVKNDGDFPVEYCRIRVMCGEEELLFDISALPAGEKLVVQEKTGKTISESKATSASALVVQRANMEMSESKVQVTDNGDNTLTVKNLTNETIPTVRVFYKYYMENEKLFVGGIAFTVRISRLGAGASVTIQPSHYTSQTSRVVMVLTYDSEV